MDVATWVAMLERRGYHIEVSQEGGMLHYDIADVQRGHRGAAHLRQMKYKNLRKQIDDELGHGMQHSVHTSCGFLLLKARAGYTRHSDPFHNVEEPTRKIEYYAAPRQYEQGPLTTCPRCGGVLSPKTVHRVTDPEECQ